MDLQDLGLKCQTPFKSQSFGCFGWGGVKQSQFLLLRLRLEIKQKISLFQLVLKQMVPLNTAIFLIS